MKGKAIIPLVVGLGIGIFAVKYFIGIYEAKGSTQAVETTKIVRARTDIPAMAEITSEMLEMAEVPKALTPQGAFADIGKVAGRVTNQMILRGTAVGVPQLAPEGTPPGMASRIRDGYRAVAVKVNEIVGVAGWLQPGCRVDVFIVMGGGSRGKSISKAILQNVEVLAVGQKIVSKGPNPSITRSVTVLVTPDDAAKLHLAESKGKLQLAMRSQDDREEPKPAILTEGDLLEDRPSRQGETGGLAAAAAGILGQMFGKEPKIEPVQTDNTILEAMAFRNADETQGLPSKEWVVEALLGTKATQLRFESDAKDARPVTARKAVSDGAEPGGLQPVGGIQPPVGGFPMPDAESVRQAISAAAMTGLIPVPNNEDEEEVVFDDSEEMTE